MKHLACLFLFHALIWCGCEIGINYPPDDDSSVDDDDTAGQPSDDDDAADDDDNGDCGLDDQWQETEVLDECPILESYATFDPGSNVEWHWDGTGSTDPDYNQVMMTPAVINLDDDTGDGVIDEEDTPDVVFSSFYNSNFGYTQDGRLRAVSGEDGSELWTLGSGYATVGGAGVAVGDFHPAHPGPEIVAIHETGDIMGVTADGNVLWVTDPQTNPALTYAHPALADLEGDGDVEIIVGRLILDRDGNITAEGQYGWGGANSFEPMSFAADLNGDGIQEVVAGNAAYRPDGTALWYQSQVGWSNRDGAPAVGDFDGDGDPEVITVFSGMVWVLDGANGNVLHNWSLHGSGDGGPPTVADFDGDGLPEIGIADRNNYAVYEVDGTVNWHRSTADDSSNVTGSSVFDFNGDLVAEVLYADENDCWVFEGPTGLELYDYSDHASATLWELPVVADIDHDFSAEIVVASNNIWWGGWYGITVLGADERSWWPARGVWNQHAYSITNINDDGTIPANPEPPWQEWNAFRQQGLTESLDTSDLFVSEARLCTDTCPQSVTAIYRVGNQGLTNIFAGANASAYRMEAGGGYSVIATDSLPFGIAPGEITEEFALELDPAQMEGAQGIFICTDCGQGVFDEGLYRECNEDNNGVELAVELCP